MNDLLHLWLLLILLLLLLISCSWVDYWVVWSIKQEPIDWRQSIEISIFVHQLIFIFALASRCGLAISDDCLLKIGQCLTAIITIWEDNTDAIVDVLHWVAETKLHNLGHLHPKLQRRLHLPFTLWNLFSIKEILAQSIVDKRLNSLHDIRLLQPLFLNLLCQLLEHLSCLILLLERLSLFSWCLAHQQDCTFHLDIERCEPWAHLLPFSLFAFFCSQLLILCMDFSPE